MEYKYNVFSHLLKLKFKYLTTFIKAAIFPLNYLSAHLKELKNLKKNLHYTIF